MALPMAHLLCAMLYTEKYRPEYKNAPEYYLGAIAPDAIHMRKGSGAEDKRVTHLMTRGKTNDAAFMPPVFNFIRSRGDTPFNFGYALHVVTDRIWVEYYTTHCPELSDSDGHTIAQLYYNDTDQVDFMLYRNRPEREFLWKMLTAACAGNLDNLLTASEINDWKQRTLTWFDGKNSLYSGEIRHLTYERVSDFIESSADRLNRCFTGAFAVH